MVCDVYSAKAFETLIHKNVTDIVNSLLCVKYNYLTVQLKAGSVLALQVVYFVCEQYQTSTQPDIESRNLGCLYSKNG